MGDYQQLRAESGQPFQLNVGNNSHFIVKYDETLLADILRDANSLSTISQLQLLQDQRLLSEGGLTSYATVVPLLQTFANSEHVVVTTALYQVANNLKKFVTPDSEEARQLQVFFDGLSRQQVARLGWQAEAGETSDDAITRPLVLRAALYAENADAIATAHQLFVDQQTDLAALPAEVRGLVLQNEVENFG